MPGQGLSALIVGLIAIVLPLIIFRYLVRHEKKHQAQNDSDH